MNHYEFEQIEVGLMEEFEEVITEEKMELFKRLSGDCNPMHIDSGYAQKHGYKDKIVYGMLASSLYSTLVGVYLPGEKCLLNKCDVDYKRPVYINDMLKITGQVIDKREGTRRIKIKGTAINQNGEIVNSAQITVGFIKETE